MLVGLTFLPDEEPALLREVRPGLHVEDQLILRRTEIPTAALVLPLAISGLRWTRPRLLLLGVLCVLLRHLLGRCRRRRRPGAHRDLVGLRDHQRGSSRALHQPEPCSAVSQ